MTSVIVESPYYMDFFLISGAAWFIIDSLWKITHWE